MSTCIAPSEHSQPCALLSCLGLPDKPPYGWNKIVGPSVDAEIGDYMNRRGYWKPGGVVDQAIAYLRKRCGQ